MMRNDNDNTRRTIDAYTNTWHISLMNQQKPTITLPKLYATKLNKMTEVVQNTG